MVFWNYLPCVSQRRSWTGADGRYIHHFPGVSGLCRRPGFLDQVIGTALLLLLVLAITDDRNMPPGSNLAPLMIGLVVVAIGMSFGAMHGYAINPARDLGPRLFTVVAGFRNNGMTDGAHVWWVPIAAPLLGGLAGSRHL